MERDEEKTNDYADYHGGISDKMDEMNTALDGLVRAIKDSSEYTRYQRAREELHKEPELERCIHEFRKKNFQIQNSGNVNLFDEVDQLEKENTELRRKPVVEEYLSAELAFCRVVQRINWTLIEQLDFDLGFGNE